MDFQFTEEQGLFRNSIAKVMEKDITIDYVRQCDEAQEYPYRFYEKAVELGWLALPFPKEYGGMGEGMITYCIFIEEMNKVSDFGCPIESIQDGTAFGVIVDGKIVSRSSTIPTPNATKKFGLVWLGVETLPEYRRRGYAKAVVSGTTETILSRGQIPVYDHATWNKASENTAKSLGYQFYGESLRWQYPHD